MGAVWNATVLQKTGGVMTVSIFTAVLTMFAPVLVGKLSRNQCPQLFCVNKVSHVTEISSRENWVVEQRRLETGLSVWKH